jgi:hypothetical protein
MEAQVATPAAVRTAKAAFLGQKALALIARGGRLASLTPQRVGVRPQDLPYAPSQAHFDAANARLANISRMIERRARDLRRHGEGATPQRQLVLMAMLEREVDRARRAFGMFFEMFSQRGSDFAQALAAHDVIAVDCYNAIRAADPLLIRRPLLKPVCYMEHGYSPATNRRGVAMARLLGESNPFPVIRIPWDRDNPWQSVFLHEVSHNIQADLGLWRENQDAVTTRMRQQRADPLVTTIYRRWHKEIFADLAAMLLGGIASAWGMLEFLAHPGARALTYRPGGAHPTAYLRGLLLAEMAGRMGFARDAARIRAVWTSLYNPRRGHRLPQPLIGTVNRIIPAVIDEIAFQPRRNLGQRGLADVIPFTVDDEARIRRAGLRLARGQLPPGLPPRFFVSASRYALQAGGCPDRISRIVITHLASIAARQRTSPLVSQVPAAA